ASGPAYRTAPPILDENTASAVFKRTLDNPVTMSQRELLSIAPDVRNLYREATTSRRIMGEAKKDAEAPQYVTTVTSDSENAELPFHSELDIQPGNGESYSTYVNLTCPSQAIDPADSERPLIDLETVGNEPEISATFSNFVNSMPFAYQHTVQPVGPLESASSEDNHAVFDKSYQLR
ncbi:hypothetical protein C8F01DRAFT_1330429, partial [Mycena amicta]